MPDVLIDKQYKRYDKVSRYQSFPYYYNKADDKYVYGTTAWLSDSTPYTEYTCGAQDTLDSIALYFYGTPTLYWVIADFNRILDPLIKLYAGDTLKIPDFSQIFFED